jgi:hypothetical protein
MDIHRFPKTYPGPESQTPDVEGAQHLGRGRGKRDSSDRMKRSSHRSRVGLATGDGSDTKQREQCAMLLRDHAR